VDAQRQLPDELRGRREGLQRGVWPDDAEQHGDPPSAEHGTGDEPSRAMGRGTRTDRYISQPRISPFPTPTMKPGPSRNVQSWMATSDRPTVTSELASPPAAPPTSCRMVTT